MIDQMKRLTAFVAASMVAFMTVNGAVAGPSAGGLSSENVRWLGFIPFEHASTTGVNIFGKFMVVTSWKNFSLYDVSNPKHPSLLATRPFGFKFENENVSTNGKIMLFAESAPVDTLHVWDIEDKTNPVQLASAPGIGGHTQTCILRCKYSYSSDGYIVDLRDPSQPTLIGNWHEETGLEGGAHDVEEFKRGFLVTSPLTAPGQILNVRNPTKPTVLAVFQNPDPQSWLFHSGRWPNSGNDRFLLMQGEKNLFGDAYANKACSDDDGPFMTFDTTNWRKTRTLQPVDTFRVHSGTHIDGNPVFDPVNCSAHWFEEHPTFRNGGLVAIAFYDHGTRFLDVAKSGKIKEVGWFLPHGGSTSAAYWVARDVVYAADYSRGIDILEYTDAP